MSDDTKTIDSPRLQALRAKLAVAKSARDAAAGALTDEDKAEIELRKEVAQADAEREAAEQAKRDVDLDRRTDAAREENPGAQIAAISIDGYPDTFVLMHSAKAFAKWEADITAAIHNKKLDKTEISRTYAVASVIDWNGITDFGPTSLNGYTLKEYLKKNSGMVSSITNAAAKLAGAFSEARKS